MSSTSPSAAIKDPSKVKNGVSDGNLSEKSSDVDSASSTGVSSKSEFNKGTSEDGRKASTQESLSETDFQSSLTQDTEMEKSNTSDTEMRTYSGSDADVTMEKFSESESDRKSTSQLSSVSLLNCKDKQICWLSVKAVDIGRANQRNSQIK